MQPVYPTVEVNRISPLHALLLRHNLEGNDSEDVLHEAPQYLVDYQPEY
jgi:hypothetical protein